MIKVDFDNTTTIEDVIYFLKDNCKAESLTALRTILEQDDMAIITLLGELWNYNGADGTI